MFREIFRFEIQNKLRRPAVYLYLLSLLIFTILSFSKGMLPLGEKQHINSPQMIAFWSAAMSMLIMMVGSSIMGMALYRDIEFSTKDYYLTYPITPAGFFWGRFTASFLFMFLIAAGIPLGIFLGSKLGPLLGWQDASRYGPNSWSFYIQPYLTIIVPNLMFMSCIFYGLVALTRNIKVVYLGGVLLFLAYFISVFYFDRNGNLQVMILSDPFLLTGSRIQMRSNPSIVQNTRLLSFSGFFLVNRVLWSCLGVLVVLLTYWRFNFERFFAGRRDRSAIDEPRAETRQSAIPIPSVSFTPPYSRKTYIDLTRLELRNIFRDTYFWIIMGAGVTALAFAFWMPADNFGVENFPRTIDFIQVFTSTFLFFIFFILLFYTGEVLHRDRLTRYAFINDSLPPPNWVLNGSKLTALLVLAVLFSLLPLIAGIFVQVCKGYAQFDFPQYFSAIRLEILPKLIEMVLFCYAIHVVVNNKFAAHAVAIVLWIGIFLLVSTQSFDYFLFLYANVPDSHRTDMNGIGHMAGPIAWFHSYWLSFGGLLVVVAALFFHRGVSTSVKERLQLIPERFTPVTHVATGIFLVLFLTLGGWIYYNITYLNDYITHGQNIERSVCYEQTLKHYDSLPTPAVTRIRIQADLYPEKQQQFVHAFVTIANLSSKPIQQFLLDGDQLTEYELKVDGVPVPYSNPLIWQRGFLNVLHQTSDTAPYRLYTLGKPLTPGDSTVIEIRSSIAYHGFQNGLYGGNQLQNGFLFTGGLPELGYDAEDEVKSPYVRRKYHLPPRTDKDDLIPRSDPEGINTIKGGESNHLMSIDMIVSTSGDQVVAGQGDMVKRWSKDGRNYFHYVLDHPGSYPPLTAVSARFAVLTDSVDAGHKIYIQLYYYPSHNANLQRFVEGYKEALKYYSRAYGPYPYNSISLVEGDPRWGRQESSVTLGMMGEDFGWNADFVSSDQFDYCYFIACQMAAHQWWGFQVAPNETIGSLDISEGLPAYDALVMTEHKYGKDNMQWILQQYLGPYLFLRTRQEEADSPLIASNHWFSWSRRAGMELYGLRDLIGKDSMNAALQDFHDAFAYRAAGPYAGSDELYTALERHTPDSVKYFLTDGWTKNRFYESRINSLNMQPTGKADEYKVTLNVHVAKIWIDGDNKETEATGMADYIDIGIFGHPIWNAAVSRDQVNPLFLHKYKLTAGDHTFTTIVHGKPEWAGIDPYTRLIDRNTRDNTRSF